MKLSIKMKIISGFVAIFAASMLIGVYGLTSINKITRLSGEQAAIQDASASISSVLAAHYGWRQNLTVSVYSDVEFTGTYDPDSCALGTWMKSDEAKATANEEVLSLLDQIEEPHRLIHQEAKIVMDMISNGQTEEGQESFSTIILPNANTAIALLGKMSEQYTGMIDEQTKGIQAFQGQTLKVIVGMIIFVTILSLIFAVAIIKSVLTPLRRLAGSASMVAAGNFSVNFKYDVKDEIGELTQNFSMLVDTFKALVSDMNQMAKNHAEGVTDYFIDSGRYNGEFQDVVSGMNDMIGEYIGNTQAILRTVQNYADGDFSAKLAPLPGRKAYANTTLDTVSVNLKDVENSVMTLVQSAMAGNLDKRIDESGFKGGWKDIVSGMNRLLAAVDAPLVEAQEVLGRVSEGWMDVKIVGQYSGQFDKMARSINQTISILSAYISEISATLNQLASDDFNTEIKREYVGSFRDIKVSLNAIIDRLNNVMREIGIAADQVATGAEQISETSVNLSQGSSEQASAVEELNAVIDEINDNTAKNAENSTTANKLTSLAKINAEQGNAKMKEMLRSMSEINQSSQNISKIIKVIEDIAFQTNLLALNAAVEAARAGEHGKGFAVVAEEVRSLAARSQSSAKETTNLIEHAIAKVNEGTEIANSTAAALSKIVEGVDDVSVIISEIETSSKEQAVAITQVSEGISNISQVTQNNSATSEESAAASEELSSQSETLKAMINRFELK